MKITIEEIQKMKVLELKAELAQRNLDQRGVKAVLVDRLLDAMANEDKVEVGNGAAVKAPLAPSQLSQPQAPEPLAPKTREGSPKRSTRAQSQTLSPTKSVPPMSPTKVAPPESPFKPETTVAPTQSPTKAPTTDAPTQSSTKAPTTVAPTQSPTKAPTTVATTQSPAKAVSTVAPIQSPAKAVTTGPPTQSPTKPVATAAPLQSPTKPLATASPLQSPTKPVATAVPLQSPTKTVITGAPTQSPAKAVSTETTTASPAKPLQTGVTTQSTPMQSHIKPASSVPPSKTEPPLSPNKTMPSQSPPKTVSAQPSPAVKTTSSPVNSHPPKPLQNKGASDLTAPSQTPVKSDSIETPETVKNTVQEVVTGTDLPTNAKGESAEANNNNSSTLPDTVVENAEQSISSLDDQKKDGSEVPAVTSESADLEEPMDVEENDSLKRKNTEKEGQEQSGRKFKKSRTEEDYKSRILPDDEPNQDETTVQLDWYKSDLNLKISKDGFLKAEPIVFDEFPWAYAGAKATHGFTTGRVAFQVKWVGNAEVKVDFGSVEAKHVLRVGWSDVYADLQLGESSFSYGYDSQGKFFNGGEIIELENLSYEKGDTISAYLDMENDPVQIMFAKNGVSLETKIEIPKSEIEGKTFFPHILGRNTSFEVNFGESDTEFPLMDSFIFASKVEATEGNKVRGPKAPESKADCEFIMLCGLACCGKTRWAKEHKENNLEKHFQILGTSTVVERAVKKTTLGGANTPKVYDSFLMKAGKFVEKLVDMAPARRRNYILDQSNCQPIVQRRKAAGFEGFKRRAVIIFPNDEEYQKRIDAREQEQGKSVPKSTLLDMKATFSLPEVGEIFSEVEFPELKKEEAEVLLRKYNTEGKDAGFGPRQQQRSMHGGRGRGNRGNYRGGRGGQQRRGPFPFRGGRSGPPPRFPQGRFPIPPARMPRDMGPGPFRRGLPPPRRGIPPPVPRRNEFPRGQSPWSRGGFPGGPAGRGSSGPPSRPPPPRPSYQNRGGPGGGRFNPPAMNHPRAQTQQSIWSTAPPGNWGRQSGGSGHNPWVNPGAQVPDQGFGNWSQDNWVNGNGYSRNPNNSGGGGTWQGYGGQTYGSYGGGSVRR